MKRIYRGFSTKNFLKTKSFKLYDAELVKEDLLRHIFTSLRSRPFVPEFGSIINSIIFQPLDDETVEEISSDVRRILDSDPRVQVLEFDVIPDEETNTVLVAAVLNYIELNFTDRFDLNLQFEI